MMTTTAIDVQTSREQRRAHSRKQVDAIFVLAGLDVQRVWELANLYWPDAPDYDEVRMPWWLMLTTIGLIQIGWRKRVMHIQWDACAVRGIVTTDDVTRTDTYVHASSGEKAAEYLRALRTLAMGKAGG